MCVYDITLCVSYTAETIKKAILEGNTTKGGGGAIGGSSLSSANKADSKNDTSQDEKSKLRSGLSSAIISEKPNVKWEDVAGWKKKKIFFLTIYKICIMKVLMQQKKLLRKRLFYRQGFLSSLLGSESPGKAFCCMAPQVLAYGLSLIP